QCFLAERVFSDDAAAEFFHHAPHGLVIRLDTDFADIAFNDAHDKRAAFRDLRRDIGAAERISLLRIDGVDAVKRRTELSCRYRLIEQFIKSGSQYPLIDNSRADDAHI